MPSVRRPRLPVRESRRGCLPRELPSSERTMRRRNKRGICLMVAYGVYLAKSKMLGWSLSMSLGVRIHSTGKWHHDPRSGLV